MQYIIVENMYSSHLSAEVKKMLDTGWKLQGGVSVGHGQGSGASCTIFAQAMVKD